MKIQQLYHLLIGKSDASNPAKFNWKNIKAVFQASWRKGKQLSGFELENHIYEQIIWRRTQVMQNSPICWQKNSCIVCGCDVEGMTMEDRACKRDDDRKGPCYPEMMNKELWEAFKKEKNIRLFN